MNITQLLKHFSNDMLSKIRTCIPAEVESFDPENGTVNVKPLIQGIRIGSSRKVKLNTGEVVVVDDHSMPSILNVPVQMIVFDNGRITFPIKKGLQGTLSICDRDIRNFKESQTESVQGSLRKFNMNDAIFEPFLPKKAQLAGYNNDAIELKFNSTLMKIDDSGVEVTGAVKVTGGVDIAGEVDITGNVNITGHLITTGEATINAIPFTAHTHQYAPGAGTPIPTDPPA